MAEYVKDVRTEGITEGKKNAKQLSIQVLVFTPYHLAFIRQFNVKELPNIELPRGAVDGLYLNVGGFFVCVSKDINIRDIAREGGSDNRPPPKFGNNQVFTNLSRQLCA